MARESFSRAALNIWTCATAACRRYTGAPAGCGRSRSWGSRVWQRKTPAARRFLSA